LLLPYAEAVLRVADSVGQPSQAVLLSGLDAVLSFLNNDVMSMAYAEDRVLYPEITRLLATPEAAVAMGRDHQEIAWLGEQLSDLRAQLDSEPLNAFRANELRRLLFGIYALLRLHFIKEQEVYLPLIERSCTAEELASLHRRLQSERTAAGTGVLLSLEWYLAAQRAS
jgi:iron-sulfur cluster repair protein YtfE (RIC family)